MEMYKEKIGCLVHIPNVGRGQLKYVGPVDGKPGVYAGVDLLANIGKNNGCFKGRVYFETEYPQSGLFIQLEKLLPLIEVTQKKESRRNTVVMEPSLLNTRVSEDCSIINSERANRTLSSTSSIAPSTASLTPVRIARTSHTEDVSSLDSQKMAFSSTERKPESLSHYNESTSDPASFVSTNYSSNNNTLDPGLFGRHHVIKIEEQERELTLYKKLLDEQRIVLEELQPTIEEYDKNMRTMELEIEKLRRQLLAERENQRKQKEFFESEHEQLLAVVEELHKEIKSNERYFKSKSKREIFESDSEKVP